MPGLNFGLRRGMPHPNYGQHPRWPSEEIRRKRAEGAIQPAVSVPIDDEKNR